MYYRCTACQQTWYYPIDRCVFCHQPVTRVTPEKFTIRALTEVQIPSREHQKVPYTVLLLEDEHGQTHTRKTFQSYRVGETIEDTTAAASQRTVIATKIRYSLDEAADRLFRLMGPLSIENKSKIAILSSCTDSDPALLVLLVDHLLKNGAQTDNITIGERFADDKAITKAKKILAGHPLLSELELVNFSDEAHETIPFRRSLFDIPKRLIGSDLLITLTPLALQTAKENALISSHLAGVFPGQRGSNLQKIAELPFDNPILPKLLCLIDARVAAISDDQDNDRTQRTQLLFLGRDFKAMDKCMCKLFDVPEHTLLANSQYQLAGEEFDVIQSPV
ncbi:hypothetical protein AUK40_01595 [Candidatus Wirthbacteria bacterium CG2_30_54_11]|uniref:DUF362 domain-containing protein n=1 Tax=Candidatus Wirthbacteria bacterium CG2_30_54_11 TaxID=1817892 RepID=A0A1J5IMN5_9BACT|nr:MAG: hypothetical protein AUK40_01595 [Candidatus Wirthbacteria bacterium CG2_30_54_11]